MPTGPNQNKKLFMCVEVVMYLARGALFLNMITKQVGFFKKKPMKRSAAVRYKRFLLL